MIEDTPEYEAFYAVFVDPNNILFRDPEDETGFSWVGLTKVDVDSAVDEVYGEDQLNRDEIIQHLSDIAWYWVRRSEEQTIGE